MSQFPRQAPQTILDPDVDYVLRSQQCLLSEAVVSLMDIFHNVNDTTATLADHLGTEDIFMKEFEQCLTTVTFPTILHKIVMALIAKEWMFKQTAGDSQPHQNQVFYTTRLILKCYRKILETLSSHLTRMHDNTDWTGRAGVQRVTMMTISFLPALRTLSSWLICSADGLRTPIPDLLLRAAFDMEFNLFWSAYADIVSTFCLWYPASELGPPITYLFPEDELCLDFLPFEDQSCLAPRFLMGEAHAHFRKALHGDVTRGSLRHEALQKIRRLILEAFDLAKKDTVPIFHSTLSDGLVIFTHRAPEAIPSSILTASSSTTSPAVMSTIHTAEHVPPFHLCRYRPVIPDGDDRGSLARETQSLTSGFTEDVMPDVDEMSELDRVVYAVSNTAAMRDGVYE